MLRSNPLLADFKLQWLCELEAQNALPMTAVINFSQWWISRNYRPANVGVLHSNQQNFVEHSEEPYNTIPSTIFKHLTCKDCHAYLLSNSRLLGKILLKDLLKNMDWKVSSVAIYLQILFHFSQWWSNISS